MSGQRRKRWTNIDPTLGQRLVIARAPLHDYTISHCIILQSVSTLMDSQYDWHTFKTIWM